MRILLLMSQLTNLWFITFTTFFQSRLVHTLGVCAKYFIMNEFIIFRENTEKPDERTLKLLDVPIVEEVPFSQTKMRKLYPLIKEWSLNELRLCKRG